MGTLGCINDMLRRDKENRELRKLNRERIKEHHKYLVEKSKNHDLSDITIEKMEEIRKRTEEKENMDSNIVFKAKLIFLLISILLLLLGWICYQVLFK